MDLLAHCRRGIALSSRSRLYYGWYVVGACHLVAWMTWGIGVFNQGVFLAFFTHTYGWSRMALSFAPTLFYIWAGLFGVVVGQLIDRWRERFLLTSGSRRERRKELSRGGERR